MALPHFLPDSRTQRFRDQPRTLEHHAVGLPLGVLVVVGKASAWEIAPTVFTAIIAFLTFLMSWQSRREMLKEKRLAQASRVFATERREALPHDPDNIAIVSTVVNNSDLPIWEVDVRPRFSPSASEDVVASALPSTHVTIQPQDQFTVREVVPKTFVRDRKIYPSLQFVDARNQRWERVGERIHKIPG